jgi:hypothetical protein
MVGLMVPNCIEGRLGEPIEAGVLKESRESVGL